MEVNATLIVQVCLFLLLLMGLSKVLFKPMIELFEERERRIDGARKEALWSTQEAEQKRVEIETRLKQAQQQAKLKMQQLKSEAVRFEQALLDETRQKARARLDKAREELATATQKAQAELAKQVPSLSKLIIEQVTDQKHTSLTSPSGSGSQKMEMSRA